MVCIMIINISLDELVNINYGKGRFLVDVNDRMDIVEMKDDFEVMLLCVW